MVGASSARSTTSSSSNNPSAFAIFEAQPSTPRRGKDGRGSATSGDDDPSAAWLPRCVPFDTECRDCSALTSARKTRKKLRRSSYSAIPRHISWLKFRPLLAMSKANLNPLSFAHQEGGARPSNRTISCVHMVCTTRAGDPSARGKFFLTQEVDDLFSVTRLFKSNLRRLGIGLKITSPLKTRASGRWND